VAGPRDKAANMWSVDDVRLAFRHPFQVEVEVDSDDRRATRRDREPTNWVFTRLKQFSILCTLLQWLLFGLRSYPRLTVHIEYCTAAQTNAMSGKMLLIHVARLRLLSAIFHAPYSNPRGCGRSDCDLLEL
jgi:hypothetical protein